MLFVGSSSCMKPISFMYDFCQNPKEYLIKNPSIVNESYEMYKGELCTLLHVASDTNKIPAAQALLEAGADRNVTTQWRKYTPLHFARSKEMVNLLLRHGAAIECKNETGETPLHYILFERGYDNFCGYNWDQKDTKEYLKENEEVARHLLGKGANPNAFDNFGSSLLHYAVTRRSHHYIPLLRQYGANPEQRKKNVLNPYDRIHNEMLVREGKPCLEPKNEEGPTPYECAISQVSPCEVTLKAFRGYNIFFVSNKSIERLYWKDKNGKAISNIFELLQNGAEEFKRYVNSRSEKNIFDRDIKEVLMGLLEMAQKRYSRGWIRYYDYRGYCFNNVNSADLENWVGKDSIEYISDYVNDRIRDQSDKKNCEIIVEEKGVTL
jgi:hypothetical protein